MFARLSGLRIVIACLGALVALASCLFSGCGSSPATSAAPDASTDGGPALVTVVTAGGGIPSADAGAVDPFGSSSSSSGGSSSGSSGADDGSSGGEAGSSGGDASDASAPVCVLGDDSGTYVGPVCGVQADAGPCDLRSNTCCSTSALIGTCLPCANAKCPTDQATIHCLQSLECGPGLSCCGDILTLFGEVKSSCKSVPDGGTCPYVPWTATQIGVQLCKSDAECKNGQPCVHQTCTMGAVLDMCGLQSAAPLNCQ